LLFLACELPIAVLSFSAECVGDANQQDENVYKVTHERNLSTSVDPDYPFPEIVAGYESAIKRVFAVSFCGSRLYAKIVGKVI
jgi:hypothetical protein